MITASLQLKQHSSNLELFCFYFFAKTEILSVKAIKKNTIEVKEKKKGLERRIKSQQLGK